MPTGTETTLKLERTYSATPQQVFRAWTDPDQVKQWHAPSDEFEVPVADVDAREGGSYRIEMNKGDESAHGVRHIS